MYKKNKLNFFNILKQKRITTVIGAWVYYFLTSIIPLTFLLVTAFGVFGVDISLSLVEILPLEFREVAEILVNTAKNASKGVTVFFVLTVLFSGSALINQMGKDGCSIYEIDYSKDKKAFGRLWAILALGVLFFLFLCVALLFSFGEKYLFMLVPSTNVKTYLIVIICTVAVLFCFLIIIMINNFISPVRLKFYQVCSGSFFSLIIIVIGTLGMSIYLKFFGTNNAFYGSLAGIVVFLLWCYVMMSGLVLGTVFSFYLYKKHQ